MTVAEQLFQPILRGQLTAIESGPAGTAWFGRVTINSGSVNAVYSSTLIQSGKGIILQGMTLPASLGVAANSGGRIVVASLVNAVSLTFARETGVAAPWDEVIPFMIIRGS